MNGEDEKDRECTREIPRRVTWQKTTFLLKKIIL